MTEAELAQVELRQVAAADHSGWMTLYLATGDRGDHRILPAEEERALVTVRAVALDDLLAEEERVSLVVIDVRGAEASVLRGMRTTLARRPAPKILCTCVTGVAAPRGSGPRRILRAASGSRPRPASRRAERRHRADQPRGRVVARRVDRVDSGVLRVGARKVLSSLTPNT